jgi:hypothetical protein
MSSVASTPSHPSPFFATFVIGVPSPLRQERFVVLLPVKVRRFFSSRRSTPSGHISPGDGRPEPAVELLGETEYSATDYFGNEASDVSFYAAAAILFDVPPKSAKRVAAH